MAKFTTLAAWVASVRIYADTHASERDQFGRLTGRITAVHDRLYQKAIDLKLASMFVVQKVRPGPPEFVSRLRTVVARPRWWPANETLRNRGDLLGGELSAFERSWRVIREVAENSQHPSELWRSD